MRFIPSLTQRGSSVLALLGEPHASFLRSLGGVKVDFQFSTFYVYVSRSYIVSNFIYARKAS